MSQALFLYIPAEVQFTQLVEDFTRSVCSSFIDAEVIHHDNIRMVMNELFTNSVKHTQTEQVQIRMDVRTDTVKITLLDRGPGIMVKDQRPPYDQELIGHREPFRRVLDGTVYLTVCSPEQVRFTFENGGTFSDLHRLQGHGLGLSIVTKLMDQITCSTLTDGRSCWEIIKHIPR